MTVTMSIISTTWLGGEQRTDARGVAADRDTRATLLGTAHGDLVPIAARTEIDPLGASLVLRDGRLRALEIASHAGIAGRVVLTPHAASPTAATALALA